MSCCLSMAGYPQGSKCQVRYYSCLWWTWKHIQNKVGAKKKEAFYSRALAHRLKLKAFRWKTTMLLSLSLSPSSICLSISVSKPMQWKNDKQGESETTDRDELILVVYNSRHSDGVLFTGGIIGERRRSARAGALHCANKHWPLELQRVESWCQTVKYSHTGAHTTSGHAWKDTYL